MKQRPQMSPEQAQAFDAAMRRIDEALKDGREPESDLGFVRHCESLRDAGGFKHVDVLHAHIEEVRADPLYFERRTPIEQALTALGLSIDDAQGNVALTMMREQVVRALSMVPASTARHAPDLATQASKWLCGPRGQDATGLTQKTVHRHGDGGGGERGPVLALTMVHLPVLHRADFSVNDGDLGDLLWQAGIVEDPKVLIGPWQTSTTADLDAGGTKELCMQYGLGEDELISVGWLPDQTSFDTPKG